MAIGSGCTDSDFGTELFTGPTTAVATGDIDATMTARATESAMTRVVVSLDEDEFLGNDLYLAGGERLEATFDGQTLTLARDPLARDIEYFSVFSSSSSVDPIQVRFFRADGTIVGAPDVFLRPDFSVRSPVRGQTATFMDTLLLEWAPAEASANMSVRLELTCRMLDGTIAIRNVHPIYADDGSASYDLSLFPEATDPLIDRTADCMLEVEFTRVAVTSVAPPFGDGDFRTTQSRLIEDILVRF